MKTTLSTYEVVNQLMDDTFANWTRPQALAIVDYLENLEDELGEEIEFDAIAIRSDFSAYDSIEEFNKEFNTTYVSASELSRYGIVYTCNDDTFVVVNNSF